MDYSMKLDLDIKLISYQDLSRIVAVHQSAFPGSALNKLGSNAILRFYKSIFEGPYKILPLGAWEDEKLIGFSIAGIWDQVERRFVKSNLFFLALTVCLRPWLIFKGNYRNRLNLGLRLLKNAKVGGKQKSDVYDKMFGVQSIAVIKKYQGIGVGKKLLIETEKEALREGYNSMMLSVHKENVKAIEFYKKMGWVKPEGEEKWEGVMIKKLC